MGTSSTSSLGVTSTAQISSSGSVVEITPRSHFCLWHELAFATTLILDPVVGCRKSNVPVSKFLMAWYLTNHGSPSTTS